MEHEPVLAMMDAPESRRRRAYRGFVETGMAESDEEFVAALKASRLSLGTVAFRGRVQGLYLDLIRRHGRKEDASFRRMEQRLPAAAIIEVLTQETGVAPEGLRTRRRGCFVRPMAARMLLRYGGLTQRETAGELGMETGAAVSIQLRRLAQAAKTDPHLRTQVLRIEAKLEAMHNADGVSS